MPEGMQIYKEEGCIQCHSQYIRPHSADIEFYGTPSHTPDGNGTPVLIGNRRQGPDLSNIALRRSREWNRLHLINPQALSPGSRMPSYPDLFKADGKRGEALLDYLDSLKPRDSTTWHKQIFEWQLPEEIKGLSAQGEKYFSQYCTQCHGPKGRGDGPQASEFERPPRDLVMGQYLFSSSNLDTVMQQQRLAQIIKYGQPGTSMPGHEYLTDQQIADLVKFLEHLIGQKSNTL
jgi:cytochrome c1